MNDISISIFDISGTKVPDTSGVIQRFTNLNYSTIYPGGRDSTLSVHFARDARKPLPYNLWKKIRIDSNLEYAWEGVITDITETRQGSIFFTDVAAVGYWGAYMENLTINKRWADNRLTNDIWALAPGTSAAEKASLTRSTVLRFVPKAEEWFNGQFAQVAYTMPTGETVKRITHDYDFSERAEDSPKVVFHFDSGVGYTDLTNTYDGNAATNDAVTLTTGDFIYVDVLNETTFNRLHFDLGTTVNAVASVMTAEYPTEDSAGNITWNALGITDGTRDTATLTKTLAQDGDVTFVRPDDVARTTVNSSNSAWVRLKVSVNLTAGVNINEITLAEIQAWEIQTHDGTSAIWSQTITGTGSRNDTLGTPVNIVRLRYFARAKQTSPSNGTVYGEISNLMVYSETGAIDFHQIITDIIGILNGEGVVSADTWALKSALTQTLAPFYTSGHETVGSIIRRAAAFGSPSQEQIVYGLGKSARASDGLPIMFSGVASDNETRYKTSMSQTGGAGVRLNYNDIENWIVVEYTDELGQQVSLTPDDDASLTDADSVSKYGTRVGKLSVGAASAAMALNAGQRYLAQKKDPTYAVTSPIQAVGSISGSSGSPIPASLVQAGYKLEISDYIAADGNPLTLLVTATDYDHDSQTVSITLGIPDDFSVFLEQAGLK